MKKQLAALLAALCLLSGCSIHEKPVPMPEESSFILGMDTSCVPALEACGVRYYDSSGAEQDVFRILKKNGIHYIRVRVWNDPFDAGGHGYGGGNCDISNAVLIGKRAAAQGLRLLVDFHYSDFWADPGKQMVPKAWTGLSLEAREQALYEYTRDSLKLLADAGVEVGMVQVGNETNGGLCGEEDWSCVARLMNAGARAVREVYPRALVAVHFTNPEKGYAFYGRQLDAYGVDYDIFASSYYPYWHGTLENLSRELGAIAQTYGKQVLVAETSYAYTLADSDFHGNTIGEGAAEAGYPFTLQGQQDYLRELVNTAREIPGCMGVFYWEGTWISAGGSSWQENNALWERYGSGWASSWAAEYDPEDAGIWHGGCAVDNQALFDRQGRATETLQIFRELSKKP